MANNRERLIDAAADLFYRQGYRGTCLDEVLTTTGIARSNLYYHFQGKSELGVEVIRRWILTYETDLVGPSIGDTSLDPFDRLDALFLYAGGTQDVDSGAMGCPLGRLGSELAHAEPAVRALLDEYFTDLRDRVAATIAEAPGALIRSDVERMADLVVTVLEGGLLMSHLRADPMQVTSSGRTLVAMLREQAR